MQKNFKYISRLKIAIDIENGDGVYMKRIFIYILLLCAFRMFCHDNVFCKGNKHQISFAGGESI